MYQLQDDLALIQTVDFFPPVVDDAYSYGAIAVANALSDVYAMGGRPIIALNIVAFPKEQDMELLAEIMHGGSDKAQEAGVLIIGGHSVDDPEPKYGLSVTGLVTPGRQVTNAGAQPGDVLVLTKPLGMGILTTALKAGLLDTETTKTIVNVMATLNRAAAEAMMEVGPHACTDVTGFGLMGHLKGMTDGSDVGARISASAVPVLPQTWEHVNAGVVPGGTGRNMAFLDGAISWHSDISPEMRTVLCDAQTSGGLLISVERDAAPQLMDALRQRGVEGVQVGEITEEKTLRVEP